MLMASVVQLAATHQHIRRVAQIVPTGGKTATDSSVDNDPDPQRNERATQGQESEAEPPIVRLIDLSTERPHLM